MEDKTQTYKFWSDGFKELQQYKKNVFIKIIGPVIIGIELSAMANVPEYSPYVMMHPLWMTDLKECFNSYLFFREIKSDKNLQYKIRYTDHGSKMVSALISVRRELEILLSTDIKVQTIFESLDKFLIKGSELFILSEYNTKMNILLYLNDIEKINSYIAQINVEKSGWDLNLIKRGYLKSLDDWLEDWKQKIINRDIFMETINSNLNNLKLKKFNYSELIK